MTLAELGSARTAARLGLALLVLGSCACLDNKLADETPSARKVYIATPTSFNNYADWMTFDVPDGHGGTLGTTTVYLNDPPPDDAAEFPIGTILVKTMQPVGAPLDIHAMVKRGAGFNPKGALGWEFFELALDRKTSEPFILWRGQDPPTGEMYQALLSSKSLPAADMELQCNDCHATADAKDATFGALAALLK